MLRVDRVNLRLTWAVVIGNEKPPPYATHKRGQVGVCPSIVSDIVEPKSDKPI